MGLEIERLKKEDGVKGYTTDRRLYLDAEGKVTDDPRKGVSLLASEGKTIPAAKALELGLVEDPEDEDPEDPEDEDPEDPEDEDPEDPEDDPQVDLSKANKDALKAEAGNRGLATSGNKAELLARIQEFDNKKE